MVWLRILLQDPEERINAPQALHHEFFSPSLKSESSNMKAAGESSNGVNSSCAISKASRGQVVRNNAVGRLLAELSSGKSDEMRALAQQLKQRLIRTEHYCEQLK